MKIKFFYYGYQTAFDEAGSWSFLISLLKMLVFSVEYSRDVNVDKTFLNCKNIF